MRSIVPLPGGRSSVPMAATISIPGISTELNSFLSGINSDEEDNVKVALKSVIDADVGKALDLLAEYLQWSPVRY